MSRIKVICTDPGAFHDRHGRTVIASFEQDQVSLSLVHPNRLGWHEVGARRGETPLYQEDAPRVDRRDLGHPYMHRIKRPTSTGMARDRPAPKRTIGQPHIDLRCRGCGLARRVRGEDLWPIFVAWISASDEPIELRWIIARLP